jgi:hypothetical protein
MRNKMTVLATLKLTTAIKPTTQPVIVQKRNKLISKLAEQIELATAQAEGRSYTATRLRTIKDENGLSKTISQTKRVRECWWTADNGKLCVTLRYGAKVIELAKGKNAVELASKADLITTLETLKEAVLAGELDVQIETASGAIRSKFKI